VSTCRDAVVLAAVQDAARRYAMPFGPPWPPPLRASAVDNAGRDEEAVRSGRTKRFL